MLLFNRIQLTVFIAFAGLLSIQEIAVTAQTSSYSTECSSWNQTAQSIQANTVRSGMNVSCNANTPACSGFDCFGSIGMATFTERLYFGVEFRTCVQPIVMLFYVIVGTVTFRRTLPVDRSSTMFNFVIPGATRNISEGGNVAGNVSIFLGMIPNSQPEQASLEMNFTMLVTIFNAPRKVNYVVLPRSNVSVPSCVSETTTRPATPTRAVSVVPQLPPTGPGTSCKHSTMHQCGDHQQCYNGTCMCLTEFTWENKVCVEIFNGDEDLSNSTSSNDTNSATPTSTTGSSNDHKLIIVLSCIGVALGLGIVLVVIHCRYVRYRQRYGQHDLLVNEADNNLDEVDPPMIEA